MSHFCVLVIGNEFEQQLSPYDENIQVEPYHNEKYNETSTYNPKSKWDWYSVGGRYRGQLLLRNPEAEKIIGRPGIFQNEPIGDTDVALKADIDFEAMDARSRVQAEQTWDELQNDPTMPKFLYDIREDDTRESYLERQAGPWAPYAIVKDGEWYEQGKIGWFGTASDEQEPKDWQEIVDSLIQNSEPDALFTIVDCHI